MWKLALGFGLIAATVTIHAVGAAAWLGYMTRRLRKPEVVSQSHELFRAVLWTTIVLLFFHLVEVLLWATAYYLLPGMAGLSSMSEAIYFSVVTFTTLGYGDVTLNADWRFLAGMQAMVGITVFGLTTALIFAVIQKIWTGENMAPHVSPHEHTH